MLEFKPDYERSRQRIEAFWERELIDRPVVQFSLRRPPEQRVPEPVSGHASPAERWLDAGYMVDSALAGMRNHLYLGDTLPIVWPNLGPEVFAAFYGCAMNFGDYGTSWSEPALHDWARVDALRFDWNSFYLKKLLEMTDALLEAGRGRFIVGQSDWHPGGDAVAAFRDPQNLAVDMIEHRKDVERLLHRVTDDYLQLYDFFWEKLHAAGQPSTSWIHLLSTGGKYYIPSNDFSCMVSKAMFEEVFLPGLLREIRALDRSIYHLDGPAALRHLDTLLSISELDAIQWVPGAGREEFSRWIPVYRRVQAAGKGVQVNCSYDEIEAVMETLDPHGVCLVVRDVPQTAEAAEALLGRLERWAARSVAGVRGWQQDQTAIR